MRSLKIRRTSTFAGLTVLTATAAQTLNLSLELSLPPLQLAWTLTRILLQL